MAGSNVSIWVLAGAALGVLCGIFFGEYAAVLRPAGSLYVALLQMAVFPFLISSLLHGLGSLRPATATRFLRAGWPFWLAAWLGTLAALWLIGQGIPAARPPLVVNASHDDEAARLVSLLVPANPFADLGRNYVPAIVVFCVFYGIAIQRIDGRQGILGALEVVKRATVTIWGWVVRLAPLGVFALFADLAGTLRVDLLGSLFLYAVLFFAGAAVLAFWVIPSLIAALVPVSHRALLAELRSALVMAVVTSLPVTAVPFIIQVAERLADRSRIQDGDRDEVISTTMAVSYPFAQLGNLFVFLFMMFAAYYFQAALQGWDWLSLPLLTLLSTIGTPVSTVDAVAFLARWLGLPAEAGLLYVEMMTLTRYPQVLVSTMGLAFITILVPMSYYGRIVLRPRQLAVSVLVGAALLGALAWGCHAMQAVLIEKKPNPYLHFTLDPALAAGVTAAVERHPAVSTAADGLTVMERVRKSGVLRVGYAPSVIPFSYFNAENQLVGYDISFAYALAHDLGARLQFVPISGWAGLDDDLVAGRYDLAVGGIYVTNDRLQKVGVTRPYLENRLALIVRSAKAGRFLDGAALRKEKHLKVAAFESEIMVPLARSLFPEAEVVVVSDYGVLPADESIDAALWTLEQAKAWAAAHPGFSAVAPENFGAPFLMAYLTPPNSEEFTRFLNQWLDLKKAGGFEESMTSYWLDAHPRLAAPPRWSVIRNVLRWVD